MPGVFISYRRDDSKGFAGALLRELNRRLGPDLVFMDTEDIIGGTDFPVVLREAVASADVLLALIGGRWLDAVDAEGRRRLEDPGDFVRQEIRLALEQGKRVIPVLIDGAGMPAASALPDDLRRLADCNALGLSNEHWDEDVARLTDHIHEAMYARGVAEAAHSPIAAGFEAIPPISRNVRRFIAAAVAFGLLFAAVSVALVVMQIRWAEGAERAVAEVVGFHERRSDDGGLAYYPELRFVTADGRTVSVRGNIGASPPAYRVGDQVPVLYDPGEPARASIDTAAGRWLVAVVFAGFGVLWLLIGGVPLLIRHLRRRRYRDLLRHGRPIVTAFHSVEVVGNINVQGRNPYVLITEWRNPVSQQLVRFRSHQVWDDPTGKARNRMITVVVDPNNFRRYVMDLSFLKQSAGAGIETL